jgi:hypothetical protein
MCISAVGGEDEKEGSKRKRRGRERGEEEKEGRKKS